jgi:hypothetical protein
MTPSTTTTTRSTTTTTSTTFTPRMRRLAPGRWVVESRSQPGLGRQCTVHACSCPAFKYGQKMCWHRCLVQRAEAWLASYAAPAQLAG